MNKSRDDGNQPSTTAPTATDSRGRAAGTRFIDWLLVLMLFFVHAGGPVPDVNEPQYLSKAKHYWDSTWCEGDFFLDSADAHAVFYWTSGWLTQILPLTATAWVGRWIAWSLMAWGWCRLTGAVAPQLLAAPLAAAVFLLLDERADLSGEWIVGGFEAKGIAYALAFVAIGKILRGQWWAGFLWVGLAMAFHPLVGGWTALGFAFVWLAVPEGRPPFSQLVACGATAAVLSLPGVIPALLLNAGQPSETTAEAARIYVYERLPHHLALLTTDPEKLVPSLVAHLIGVLVFVALLIVWHRTSRDPTTNLPVRRLAAFTVAGIVIAGVGFTWELLFNADPLIGARLLRYYMYRLADFSVPLGVSGLVAVLVVSRRSGWTSLLLVIALAGSGWHLGDLLLARWERAAPRAETAKKVRNTADWHDVCTWIDKHTPRDAVFLTPRMSLTFKWRTNRGEVVTRKDIPQDAPGILAWWERMNEIHARNKPTGKRWFASPASIDTDRMRFLAQKYGFNYILSRYRERLELPIAYRNDTFAVYQVK